MTHSQIHDQKFAARWDHAQRSIDVPCPAEKNRRQTWMISFADLMAILLTFMIVAYSMREVKPASWQSMSQSLQGVFEDGTPSGSASLVGDRFESLNAINDTSIVALVEGLFSETGAARGVQLTPRGVEVDLEAIATDMNGLSDLANVLTRVDRSLLISVSTPHVADNATSIQRVLAWEKGLEDAFALRSELMAGGLLQDPRISVSVGEAEKTGATLVMSKHGRSEL